MCVPRGEFCKAPGCEPCRNLVGFWCMFTNEKVCLEDGSGGALRKTGACSNLDRLLRKRDEEPVQVA